MDTAAIEGHWIAHNMPIVVVVAAVVAWLQEFRVTPKFESPNSSSLSFVCVKRIAWLMQVFVGAQRCPGPVGLGWPLVDWRRAVVAVAK